MRNLPVVHVYAYRANVDFQVHPNTLLFLSYLAVRVRLGMRVPFWRKGPKGPAERKESHGREKAEKVLQAHQGRESESTPIPLTTGPPPRHDGRRRAGRQEDAAAAAGGLPRLRGKRRRHTLWSPTALQKTRAEPDSGSAHTKPKGFFTCSYSAPPEAMRQ